MKKIGFVYVVTSIVFAVCQVYLFLYASLDDYELVSFYLFPPVILALAFLHKGYKMIRSKNTIIEQFTPDIHKTKKVKFTISNKVAWNLILSNFVIVLLVLGSLFILPDDGDLGPLGFYFTAGVMWLTYFIITLYLFTFVARKGENIGNTLVHGGIQSSPMRELVVFIIFFITTVCLVFYTVQNYLYSERLQVLKIQGKAEIEFFGKLQPGSSDFFAELRMGSSYEEVRSYYEEVLGWEPREYSRYIDDPRSFAHVYGDCDGKVKPYYVPDSNSLLFYLDDRLILKKLTIDDKQAPYGRRAGIMYEGIIVYDKNIFEFDDSGSISTVCGKSPVMSVFLKELDINLDSDQGKLDSDWDKYEIIPATSQ